MITSYHGFKSSLGGDDTLVYEGWGSYDIAPMTVPMVAKLSVRMTDHAHKQKMRHGAERGKFIEDSEVIETLKSAVPYAMLYMTQGKLWPQENFIVIRETDQKTVSLSLTMSYDRNEDWHFHIKVITLIRDRFRRIGDHQFVIHMTRDGKVRHYNHNGPHPMRLETRQKEKQRRDEFKNAYADKRRQTGEYRR